MLDTAGRLEKTHLGCIVVPAAIITQEVDIRPAIDLPEDLLVSVVVGHVVAATAAATAVSSWPRPVIAVKFTSVPTSVANRRKRSHAGHITIYSGSSRSDIYTYAVLRHLVPRTAQEPDHTDIKRHICVEESCHTDPNRHKHGLVYTEDPDKPIGLGTG